MNVSRLGTIVLTTLLLGGCASANKNPISIAFDDLTNEGRSSKAKYANFSTFVSISTLVPANTLQSFWYQDDGLPPTHALGMSPKWTFRARRDYDMTIAAAARPQAIADLRSAYVALRANAIEIGALNTLVAMGKATLALPQDKTPDLPAQMQSIGEMFTLGPGKVTRDTLAEAVKAKQQRLDVLQSQADQKEKELQEKLKTWNVLMTRWSSSNSTSAGAEVDPLAGAGYEESRSKSGVLILGDIRAESLHVGEDIFDLLRELNRGSKQYYGSTRISVFEVRARYVAYVADEDFSRAITAFLDLDPTEVQALSAAVRNAAIRAQISFSAMASFGGSGLMSSSKPVKATSVFYPPSLLQKKLEQQIDDDLGYEAVYVVRAQLNTMVAKTLPKRICTHLQSLTEGVADPHAGALKWLQAIDSTITPGQAEALFAGTRYAKNSNRIESSPQCAERADELAR
ncbi:MAG TPA: hypothetical protein VJV75_12050 [Candidatus Polarisedimenticolia bacterium]|nr:hypothetical protein [Candidatus Polarisedimenticolia bacterium]